MTALTPKDVVQRFQRAKDRRATWETHWQFSCWNEGDPNRKTIEAVTTDDKVFASCVRIACRAVAGSLADPTGGATHYHTAAVYPPWARGRAPTAVIGAHLFYANVE